MHAPNPQAHACTSGMPADVQHAQVTEVVLSSRVLRLPLAFQEQWTHAAVQNHMQTMI